MTNAEFEARAMGVDGGDGGGAPRRYHALDELPGVLAALGVARVLLVTGASQRFVERVRERLDGMPLVVFSGARRHVPESVLQEALAVLDDIGAIAGDGAGSIGVVALGGGSAIGLCKALRLERAVAFVAIPTTYSGSEMTDIYGIRRGDDKVTGRDARVRPDAVIHDVDLTLEMPRALTISSLMNALAHPIAALASGALDGEYARLASRAVVDLYAAIETLTASPDSRRARADALAAAALGARTLEAGKLGAHHHLAHLLGGRFDLEHGVLHSLLLPHSVARMRRDRSEPVRRALAAIDEALRVPDLEAALFDTLVRAGVPTSLAALGVSAGQIAELLAELYARSGSGGGGGDDDVPRDLLWAAWHGRRPSREVERADWGLREPVSLRGDLTRARRVVIALHGRGATADGIVRRVLEIVGDDPAVAVVAPHAHGNAWYASRFTAPLAEIGDELDTARAEVQAVITRVLGQVPAERVVLFGYSQGACLALHVASRGQRAVAAVVALSGALIGSDDEIAAALIAPASVALAGVPVLLGASDGDAWIPAARLTASAEVMRGLGADVRVERVPGDVHALHLRHRLLARPLLSGLAAAAPPEGLGNAHAFEGLPGALPKDGNTPRRAPYGLYPEQLSVTGFSAPRAHNRRTWLYRVRPAARHGRFEPVSHPTLASRFDDGAAPEPNLYALAPLSIPDAPTDFIDGLHTLGGAGSPEHRRGFAVHLYAANRNMEERAFHDADGDLMILPQRGALTLFTELGALAVRPGMLALVPRGLRFSVQLDDGDAGGWVAEVFGAGFELPERGPVGANGLADARHFRGPEPFFEDRLVLDQRIAMKLGGVLYEARQDSSPFDVVAWHGNAVPMCYDLARFNPIGFVRVDHIDPSAHTVLSAPLDGPGANALDLVAFVPRWDASENTFRPPYFHRNVTTEINGIIRHRAPADSPFRPGLTFVTPSLVPHGVVAAAVERAFALDDDTANRPTRSSDASLWFQLESALPLVLTSWASERRDRDWQHVWGAYRPHFSTR